eukprot:15340346-Ditylum_brightwellii.AAC.1
MVDFTNHSEAGYAHNRSRPDHSAMQTKHCIARMGKHRLNTNWSTVHASIYSSIPATDATKDKGVICITLPASYEPKQMVPSIQHTTFLKYVQTLEEWECSVLEEVDMEVKEDELKELSQDNIQLFLVSDGGEIDGLGYFGWVIGTHMDVQVKHKGHIPGDPDLIESLQIKNVGALSLLSKKGEIVPTAHSSQPHQYTSSRL